MNGDLRVLLAIFFLCLAFVIASPLGTWLLQRFLG